MIMTLGFHYEVHTFKGSFYLSPLLKLKIYLPLCLLDEANRKYIACLWAFSDFAKAIVLACISPSSVSLMPSPPPCES